jgi:cell division inhibitor SepF
VNALDFGDAKLLADRIRERTPVVLNLRETDPEMVRRLVDFASGLTYALDGTMSKISEGVILVLPPRMSLGREEKRRLQELGLYGLPDVGGGAR